MEGCPNCPPQVHNVAAGYPYTDHLKEMDRRHPGPGCREPPSWLRTITSPLVLAGWRELLKGHPDAEYRDYILRGLEQGFRIGFNYQKHACKGAKTNMKSALSQCEVVDKYLAKEVELGRVIGPLSPASFPEATISRFGVIPKGRQVGKWRLIVDLSHPKGASVNDGIEAELCHVP